MTFRSDSVIMATAVATVMGGGAVLGLTKNGLGSYDPSFSWCSPSTLTSLPHGGLFFARLLRARNTETELFSGHPKKVHCKLFLFLV
jgi:hypothetical protein